ncbi:holo-ACP synthase [Mucilaginibacter calamicampi]|uniref:Holo-ACP synthase n=1 Tax=Mucilaginibacter calamicampi TaxID=1302352 RepID=A0ABW2YYD8_9SPHI
METKLTETLEGLTAQQFAVGNDLVFVPGFEPSLTPGFKNKVYTEQEIAWCDQFADSLLRYASTWAAKEAVYKAVKQLDKTTAGWKKIEIIREKIGGRPHVILHQPQLSAINVSLSITHDGDYAWAVAIAKVK